MITVDLSRYSDASHFQESSFLHHPSKYYSGRPRVLVLVPSLVLRRVSMVRRVLNVSDYHLSAMFPFFIFTFIISSTYLLNEINFISSWFIFNALIPHYRSRLPVFFILPLSLSLAKRTIFSHWHRRLL